MLRNLTVCACALVAVLWIASDASAFGGKRRASCGTSCAPSCSPAPAPCYTPPPPPPPPPPPVCQPCQPTCQPASSCGTRRGLCGGGGGKLFGGRGGCR